LFYTTIGPLKYSQKHLLHYNCKAPQVVGRSMDSTAENCFEFREKKNDILLIVKRK